MRQRIEIPYEMFKKLMAVYVQARIWSDKFVRVEDLKFDEQIGDRTLDIVANLGGSILFIEIQMEEAPLEFIEEYYQFCQKHSPGEAWLVTSTKKREDRKLNPTMMFENQWLISFFRIIPIGDVLEDLQSFYRLRLEEKDGLPMLTLDPTLTQESKSTFRGLP